MSPVTAEIHFSANESLALAHLMVDYMLFQHDHQLQRESIVAIFWTASWDLKIQRTECLLQRISSFFSFVEWKLAKLSIQWSHAEYKIGNINYKYSQCKMVEITWNSAWELSSLYFVTNDMQFIRCLNIIWNRNAHRSNEIQRALLPKTWMLT